MQSRKEKNRTEKRDEEFPKTVAGGHGDSRRHERSRRCRRARARRAPAPANVVWNSPSTGANGSMPLGNGEVGVNLWVEKGRRFAVLYRAHRRLERVLPTAKTGTGSRVDGAKPVRGRSADRQTLDLRNGCVDISAGSVSLRGCSSTRSCRSST